MKVKMIECPYCGGNIDVDIQNRDFVFCSYCGKQIYIDRNKKEYYYYKNVKVDKNISVNYRDDAEIIKLKNEEKRDKRGLIVAFVLSCLLIIIPLCMLGYSKMKEDIAKSEGKISAGYYDDFIGENYKSVKSHFQSAGFTNIKLIDLDDSGLKFWSEDDVESVSVGGNMKFQSSDYFYPDSQVVISYH